MIFPIGQKVCTSTTSYSFKNSVFGAAQKSEFTSGVQLGEADKDTKNVVKKQPKSLNKILEHGFLGIGILLAALTVAVLTPKSSAAVTKQVSKTNVADASKQKMLEFINYANDSSIPDISNCQTLNEDLKKLLVRQINHMKADADIINEVKLGKPSNRFMLVGKPGVGKSFYAKIFAKSINAEYVEVGVADYSSKWAGETLESFISIFQQTLEKAKSNPNKKYVLVLNECDALAQSPENLIQGQGYSLFKMEIRNILINFLDKLKEEAPNVTIFATSNISARNTNLDGAFKRRFNMLEVPLPDKAILEKALIVKLSEFKSGKALIEDNKEKIVRLANLMESKGFSFANLDTVMDISKEYYLEQALAGNREYKISYLEQAINEIKFADGKINK